MGGFMDGHRHSEVRAALALYTILWTSTFIFALKREVSWRLVQWGEGRHLGVSSVKPRESPRFNGTLRPSEIDTNLEEVNVPHTVKARGRRNLQILVSLFACVVCAIMFSIYIGAAWLEE